MNLRRNARLISHSCQIKTWSNSITAAARQQPKYKQEKWLFREKSELPQLNISSFWILTLLVKKRPTVSNGETPAPRFHPWLTPGWEATRCQRRLCRSSPLVAMCRRAGLLGYFEPESGDASSCCSLSDHQFKWKTWMHLFFQLPLPGFRRHLRRAFGHVTASNHLGDDYNR